MDGILQNRYTMSVATVATRNLFSLYDCIQNGDVELLKRQLATCTTDINSVLPCKGVGILHLAVGIDPSHTSTQCTEIILKHGGNANLCSEDGMTPVHIAAIWGRLENLRLLVACGGDPMRRDDYGMTAFDYARDEQQYGVLDYLQRHFEHYLDGRNAEKIKEGAEEKNTCRYSLQLDRILVSTGHIVAEYGTVSSTQLSDVSVCRKSEMVRAWCEQTSRVNHLYPTILNQTYLLQDESRPWKPGDFTNDTRVQTDNTQSQDESYNTCKDNLNDSSISGVEPLQGTRAEEDPECDCSCHSDVSIQNPRTQRVSVYENFSLPGSPTNIVHQNYNSKTNLKKNKSNSTNNTKRWSGCKKKCLLKTKKKQMKNPKNKKSNTNDRSQNVDYKQLNDALATVQNETNEWLSHSNSSNDSDEHSRVILDESINQHNVTVALETFTIAEQSLISADDTRRLSQRSSGVNSTVSSGSIAIASVQEEYKYEDKEEDVVLIERRLLVPSVVLSIEEAASEELNPEASRHSVASSLPASIDYDAHTLRAELTARGFTPGPISHATKRLYLRKLKNLKKNPLVTTTPQGKTYSVELERSLRNETWFEDLSPYIELENKVRTDFANPKNIRSWREGSAKTSFTYLLLDPRLTDNLPSKATSQGKHATWTTFVKSIFYVGKGKRSRPYSHLYQALTLWKRNFRTSDDKKVQHILDIWSAQVGVVCLHVFQNVVPAEAYTYEAAMIDVLGVGNLENLKSGNYYGVAASLPLKERRMLGLYLLYRAMLIFLSEGERQLHPGDID